MAEKICTSCKSIIAPTENYSEFPCPKCGETIIVRCSKCKVLVNEYVCEKCGFRGP